MRAPARLSELDFFSPIRSMGAAYAVQSRQNVSAVTDPWLEVGGFGEEQA